MVNVKRSDKATERTREIGASLKSARLEKYLSLEKVARKLDPPVTFQTLAKWEKGDLGITIDRLEQLAKIYRVDVTQLLNYTVKGPRPRRRRVRMRVDE